MKRHLSTKLSIYVSEPEGGERYVVMFAAAYSAEDLELDGLEGPKGAALAALNLTRDEGSEDTYWYVLDRETGQVHEFEQSEFEQ